MAISESIKPDVETAARILREAGAEEVYIFGSAAHGEERPESDIDMAVRGLPPEVFFKTMAEIVFSIRRELDLIDLDEPNLFTEYLEKKGELVRVA